MPPVKSWPNLALSFSNACATIRARVEEGEETVPFQIDACFFGRPLEYQISIATHIVLLF